MGRPIWGVSKSPMVLMCWHSIGVYSPNTNVEVSAGGIPFLAGSGERMLIQPARSFVVLWFLQHAASSWSWTCCLWRTKSVLTGRFIMISDTTVRGNTVAMYGLLLENRTAPPALTNTSTPMSNLLKLSAPNWPHHSSMSMTTRALPDEPWRKVFLT
jgi:hypothetical protein